jgi:hypothetical protein
MRIVLTLFVCCSIGCSGIDLLDMDLNLAAPEGGVELTSLAMDGESVQVTRSNNTAADGAGHFDLPIGEYYGIGINEDNDVTLHGGLTYRPQANFSIFAGASVNTDSDNAFGVEYGTQFLMKNFSLELRRDEENDLTMFGIGKEF